MPDPSKKLVKVDDDVIAFPDSLEDGHVANAIKLFRAKKTAGPPFGGVTTEACQSMLVS